MPFSYNKNVKREKHENAQMSRPGQKRNVHLLFYVIFQNNVKLNYANCENVVVRNERTSYLVVKDRCEASIETLFGRFYGEYRIARTPQRCVLTGEVRAHFVFGVLQRSEWDRYKVTARIYAKRRNASAFRSSWVNETDNFSVIHVCRAKTKRN